MLGSYHNYESQPRISKSSMVVAFTLLGIVGTVLLVALAMPRMSGSFHLSQALAEQEEFHAFMTKYGKVYELSLIHI